MSRTRTRWLSVALATLVVGALLPGSAALAYAPPGGIAGRLLDRFAPIPNAQVNVLGQDFSFIGQARTDASGAFTINAIPEGTYFVAFDLPGGLTQFSHQKLSLNLADPIVVTSGAVAQLEELVVPHGSLAGTLTSSAGTPVASAQVSAASASGDVFLNGRTDAAGQYVLPFVPPGSYTIGFFDPATRLAQNAHQKLFQPGDPFTVTVGATTTVDEQFLPTGSFEGHVTTPAGAPAAFVQVSANGLGGGFGSTDANGFYHLDVYPGSYQLQFQQTPGNLTQWAHQKTSPTQAQSFAVTARATTTVDEVLLPTGTLAGHLTTADGTPPMFGQVSITSGNQSVTASTDSNGDWQAKVFPGTYKVEFITPIGIQWATGKTAPSTANTFTVTANQTVRVDDTLARPGSVTVTVHDSVTGQPVPTFCVGIVGLFTSPCTDTGSATVPAVLPGVQEVFLNLQGNYIFNGVANVTVTSGQNSTIDILAVPAASVTMTIRDAKTGAALANICLLPVRTTAPSSVAAGVGNCTNTNGVITVGQLVPGAYNMFAFASDHVHGHQWVGPSGGTGEQKKAAVTTLAAGQSLTLPDIRMDKRGTLTGIIRDKVSGAPLPGAVAGFATSPAGLGGSSAEVTADATGRYTFTDLGPYDWPIFFKREGFASEWSGNTGNRLKANPIRVRAGKTKNHDETLSPGVTLTGVVTSATGGPVDEFAARISVISESRDEIGVGDSDINGRYTVHVLPLQSVALNVAGRSAGTAFDFFYPSAPDFEHATFIKIQKPGPLLVNITLPPAS